MLYPTCTCYNCIPEDELSVSRQVYVEDIVIRKLIKFQRGAFFGPHFVTVDEYRCGTN